MQQPPVQPFDDPALKAALRRSLGQESAPAALRDRIKAMAGQNAPVAQKTAPFSADQQKPIPLFRRSPLYRLAVAAVLVIGFGGLAYQIWQMNKSPYDQTQVFSSALYQSMLDTHHARQNMTGTDPVTSMDSAASLSAQIGQPVFVADLTREGWTFKGGAVRKVGSDQAAELYFTKGKSAVSVFSLPASLVPNAKEGQSYEVLFGGAAIAGFTKGKGLFCIVETNQDGPVTDSGQVRRLLEVHQNQISKG
jgi:hypothetical protein